MGATAIGTVTVAAAAAAVAAAAFAAANWLAGAVAQQQPSNVRQTELLLFIFSSK